MKIAFISDIHEDYPSLKKALKKIDRAGYDKLVCLGDVSGYSVPYYKYFEDRDAHGCLSMLREKEALIIPGNHDFYAARHLPVEGSSFVFPEDWYALDTFERRELSQDKIWLHEQNDLDPLYTREDILFLRSLDEYQVLEMNDLNMLFTHYIYPNMAGFKKGFYVSAGEFRQHFDFMGRNDCQLSFTGHAHVRGFYTVTPYHFKHHPFTRSAMKIVPVVIGVPPLTRHKKRSGYGVFDMEERKFRAMRL
ncbi:MAG TPA: metallophosphoesterase [Bacteroidales bacterium]|nr:metallophosphoesterase [Bacteroidales bacterium]